MIQRLSLFVLFTLLALPLFAEEPPGTSNRLEPMDVFELELATDPRIAKDGQSVVYVRNFMDRMHDRRRSNLWRVESGGEQRPLTTGLENHRSPRFSPDGEKLLYTSGEDGSTQLYVRWLDTGQTARLTQLPSTPRGLTWSPDGRHVAFEMFVEEKPERFVELPKEPEGAEWAEKPIEIDEIVYRTDGGGYSDEGHDQIFVLSAEGGTARQVTSGAFHHQGPPVWTPDGQALVFAANRREGWEYEPQDTELFELTLATGELRQLTDRHGPDHSPAVSPDGKTIAYLGRDERYLGFQIDRLHVMPRAGGEPKVLAAELDRDLTSDPVWSADGQSLYVSYDDRGNGKIAKIGLDGGVVIMAQDLGGTSIGRPYGGGSFTVAPNGEIAYTHTRPDHPADVALVLPGGLMRLTELNRDLFSWKELAEVEEIVYPSSHDGREIQAWVAKPPGFDPAKKHPLVLEIHGGPFADYGDRFASEIQLYAAAGYVVLYVNPRGSSSYGEEFGNLIHHAYPGNDYDDLISGVDVLIERGWVDPERLFVTGGSGGGVLTAWIVGKTDRFRAAVVAKPVINWTSFVFTADNAHFFYKYWFPGFPWEAPEQYFERSPLSLAGSVKTPTMVLTGEADYRTPISESEQYYQALRLQKVPTMLVRIPGASHGIARRPSQLMAKVAYVLKWFETHGK